MPHPASKSEEYLRTERRNRVADLYVKGWSQSRIAESEGVSQPTIHNDLQAIRKQWIDETLTNFDEVQARELAKIDALESTAWAAWERSCEDLVTITTEEKKALRASAEEAVEEKLSGLAAKLTGVQVEKVMTPVEENKKSVVRGQAGDERFLGRIAWCIEQRVKIFGLIKSDKKTADTVVNINWNNYKERSPIEDPVQIRIKQIQEGTLPSAVVVEPELQGVEDE